LRGSVLAESTVRGFRQTTEVEFRDRAKEALGETIEPYDRIRGHSGDTRSVPRALGARVAETYPLRLQSVNGDS
jgi:hypothetical protein